ncbi:MULTISPECIES: MarR family transcriptional regulator [unclassified Arcicella]|uniref:MarR family winged helix-turn-helix transcriptional regulator n=1 Tax=unclassified Arcicella TaxID=2644986 RepID=UPI0028586D3A|nr:MULTISPECIES: MarR family transcriptional regulator [unclassified Arcicella]MDR6563145.1 DNA-binding MarR family transcriptional regulator [Arcicella sp. BE51]MDR6811704.1 DNA-binding MarR family transcriptional regulator [Arcicella sp. BE140]MDR6823229.1 DNA-binding MarR family transcriptional regulator [Arcicella sp. BE139]
MSIEKDIKQASFKSAHAKAMVNIVYTNNWLTTLQMEVFKPFDLTLQQYNVLRILRGHYPEPITVIGIIERMLDKMSNASRLVDKLLLKEMVVRRECPNDRRAVDILITQKGLDLLAELDVLQKQWEKQMYGLTESEALQLSDLLDKLRQSPPESEQQKK